MRIPLMDVLPPELELDWPPASDLKQSAPGSLTFVFENERVRVVVIDGEPWFVASDVASVLGYACTADAIREHCKGVGETTTPLAGGAQRTKIIPERDVYRLIMRSKLPAARGVA